MLVYANALKLEGSDAFDVAVRTIHGWLSDQIGQKIPLAELLKRNEWRSDAGRPSAWLRAYAAVGGTPEMYAWRLKHADENVRGRQWAVELGLKCEADAVEFACTIQTEELSVLVTESVTASRPRLVRYLLSNLRDDSEARLAPEVPGKALKTVGQGQDTYRALLDSIEQPQRDHPIVMVSPGRDGGYLVNPIHLQESLVGLAQVVRVDENFNSYDMEEILGRHYSAWDGAINVIQMPNQRGFARGNVFRSDEIAQWGKTNTDRVATILAHVTHNTNVPRLRKRIRPDGVARLSLRRRMEAQRQRLREGTGSEKDMIKLLESGLDELTEQNETLQAEVEQKDSVIEQLQLDKQQLDDGLRAERYKSRAQRQHVERDTEAADLSFFMDLASRQDQPSPQECLEAVERAYPDRVEVLDSAYDSARDHAGFGQGQRLLGLLKTLCTKFVQAMSEGGDDAARKVFTPDAYAANESEGTQNNKAMRQARTFTYNDQPLEMWRHLKIGVADDQRKSIRVYFEWVPNKRKVVIGHCGAHLPVINH